MQQRIGIFSGTFDPVHKGHISFALAAKEQYALDSVIFLPEREPRGKLSVSDFEHRLRMLKLATDEHNGFYATALDQNRFTVAETLPRLRELYPNADLVLLIGSDAIKTFKYRWSGLDQLLNEMELAIGLRMGETAQEVRGIIESLDIPVRFKIITSNDGYAVASATVVRDGNLDLVPPAVCKYIKSQLLYR